MSGKFNSGKSTLIHLLKSFLIKEGFNTDKRLDSDHSGETNLNERIKNMKEGITIKLNETYIK